MRSQVFRLLLLIGVMLLASAPVLLAQPNMDPEARLDQTMEEVTEAVGLSEEQATAIRPILAVEFEKQMEAFTAARESGAGFEGVREKMETLRVETDEKVAALLDEEQMEKWAQWREDVAERRRQRRSGG